MPIKVGPPRQDYVSCNFGCDRVQTYWPKIYKPPQDPCKDACGAWKKFKVRVLKDCPLCVTFLNLNGFGVEGYQCFYKNGCDTYKPMKPISFEQEQCDLMLMKPGAYEFRPVDGTTFPKDFDWVTTPVSHEGLANMIATGESHVLF